MPSSRASTSIALGGTEKCCQTPGKSVNRKSTISTFLSLIVLRTSGDVAQLRAIIFLPRLRAVPSEHRSSTDQPVPNEISADINLIAYPTSPPFPPFHHSPHLHPP